VQTTRRARRKPGILIAALVTSFGLVAAACGGDDGGSESTPTTAGGGSTETTAAGGGTTDTTAAPSMEPQAGGRVVMGIEADTGSPWTPAKFSPAIAGHMVAQAVYDPLVKLNADGTATIPYLASSIEPNADYTVWTLGIREGVTFHDGTPLDAAAVVDNLVRQTKSLLVGQALQLIKGSSPDPAANTVATDGVVAIDDMTVEVRLSSPWTSFPLYLVGQPGYIGSPTWLAAADADPTLEPKPVGTGPFVFKDYKPGDTFTATKNPNYWNQPYPYLDEVQFKVIPDALSRKSALESGDVDIIHTTNGDTIAEYREGKDGLKAIEYTNFGETGYTLLNVGDPESPLSDSRVRCAMANAYDGQAVIDKISSGVNPIANGPFSAGQPGNLAENAYPTAQDMDKAKELVASWKADNPGKELAIKLSTTQDATNLVIAQAQQQYFLEAGFDKVDISQIEQAQYIITALFGDFQAFQWRNHGGVDLDNQYIWWHSSTAAPFGSLALNFGRMKDARIDELLELNRAESDPAKKLAYAEEVNNIFAEQCYNLWGSYTVWMIAMREGVEGVGEFTTPEGEKTLAGFTGNGGFFPIAGLWLSK
jgi:peptide/nickel transport system substrate-binding protein